MSGNIYSKYWNIWCQKLENLKNTQNFITFPALAKNYIFTPNYLKINYFINWANLIYKTHEDYGRVTFYRCSFECYGDTLCDFFVYDYDNGSPDCYYGRFSLTDGSTYSMKNLNIYLKNGKKLG